MKDIQVFAEYKILPEKREEYLHKIKDVAAAMKMIGVDDFTLQEGVDQPGLFVEMFHVPSMEAYRKIKRKRCEDTAALGAFWQSINDCIAGGTDKLHMWAFASIDITGSEE
ncbi:MULTISPECIES: MFS transporter [Aneurinibacillus]|jgi:hypothetical protein|uniref:NIPSNAP domain-containing protein n=1 Tax=Aneurinibacillus danicus TaxID=267746 RepID=A0A511V4N4_9BACL|nr:MULTISPECIES: MFS transporter [Aneurinibacillus]GEN33884.1 hypothetical protein ADA01nite_13440 [Aneurinibacillus danicus]